MDNFDYHQSSNRVAIERAFGMLVKRWAILWKPLAMRFDRRAPVIGACIRLHNFCIDKRIEHDMREECDGRYSQVQPSRYEKIPKFDKDGRPVEYLKFVKGPARRHARMARSSHTFVRDKLVDAVRASGIFRPRRPLGLLKKKKKKQKQRA